MRVQETYHTQSSHDQLTNLVEREIQCWKGRKITEIPANVIGIGFYAVSTRVLAAVYGVIWVAGEAVTFVPRMAMLGLRIAVSSPVSTATALRIVKVYATSLGVTALQGASYVAAITLPEFLFGYFNGQKTFFLHHIEVFTQTLPELSEVYGPIDEMFDEDVFESLSKVGGINQEWRTALKLELCRRYQQNPECGPDLLDPTPNAFRKILFAALLSQIITTINDRVKSKTLALQDIIHLDCKTVAWIHAELTLDARQKLFTLRPELESGLEDAVDHAGALFELHTDYRFRSPHSVAISALLLENMKQAQSSLIADKTFTPDEIAEVMEAPMSAIFCKAIYSFVSSARLSLDENPHVILRGMDGKEIRIRDDNQFFKTRQQLVDLHRAIYSISSKQRAHLIERLSGKDSPYDPQVQEVFNMIVSLKYQFEKQVMANEKLREQDQTHWLDAFTVSDI